MFQFSLIGLLALIAVFMCLSLALVIFRTGMRGGTARRLSLLLVVEGVTLISTGYIDLFLGPDISSLPWYPAWVEAEAIIHTLGDCAMLALYPPFLGMALQTPLTRPFNNRRVRAGLFIVAAML